MDKSDQFYQQVTESIKLVFDLTSRIDERVKILIEQQDAAHERTDKIMDKQESLVARIAVLENRNAGDMKEDIVELKKFSREMDIKLAGLMIQSGSQENKWKLAIDFVIKFVLAVIGAVIAWRLSSH